jgi:hypothetical protein
MALRNTDWVLVFGLALCAASIAITGALLADIVF